MTLFEIIFLAVALSMDAFSVALASGLSSQNTRQSQALKMAFFFGLFQFLMPIFGNGAALFFVNKISAYSDVVVFIILFLLGIRMIYENIKGDELPENVFSLTSVILLAFATSIDALAAGVGLGALTNSINNAGIFNSSILFASAIIGIIAFIFSYAGVIIGSRARFLGFRRAGIIGGIMLIILAVRSLVSFIM